MNRVDRTKPRATEATAPALRAAGAAVGATAPAPCAAGAAACGAASAMAATQAAPRARAGHVPARVLACGLALALALGACSRHASDDQAPPREDIALTKTGETKPQRKLTQAEIDTLRVMKHRLGITRDRYWDTWGGLLANDWAEVRYPTGNLSVGFAMYAFQGLAEGRRRLHEAFGWAPDERVVVVCSPSMEAFRDACHCDWWRYGVIDGDRRIVLQPAVVLFQRGLVTTGPAHVYVRWALRRRAGKRLPRWIEYGLASVLVDEGRLLRDFLVEFPDDPVVRDPHDVEKHLDERRDKRAYRIARYNAWRMVRRLVKLRGRDAVGAFVDALAEGASREGASRRAFDAPWDDVVREAAAWNTEDDR